MLFRSSEQLPTAQLHWIIADKDSCIVVESMKDGLHVYDNPVGVLTNNIKAENREYGGCRFVIELPKQKDEII